jgi:hypothetical protein
MALKLAEVLALEPNWDSYGAAAVSRESVVAALEDVLPLVMEDGTFLPAVVPTPRGGIQFEWHMCGLDVEIEVSRDGNARVIVEDLDTGEVWYGELFANVDRLSRLFSRLLRTNH